MSRHNDKVNKYFEKKNLLEGVSSFFGDFLEEGGMDQHRLYYEEDTTPEELTEEEPETDAEEISLKDISDLVENFLLLSERGALPEEVSKKSKAPTTASDVIPFPTIKITEDWGKVDSGDREILELLMKNIKGDTVESKLDGVTSFLTYQPGRPINDIFSNLLFTEIFSNIMDEFNASTAGFLFEAFLAGLFGGKGSFQIGDKDEETGNLPIVDVELKNVPYSLKVLSRTTEVKGSFFNLVNHFDQSDYLIYLVVEKQGEGVLTFREFTLNAGSFLNYIGYSEAGKEVVKRVDITGVPAKDIGLDDDQPREDQEIPGVGTFVYTDPKSKKDYDIIGKLKKSSGGKYRHAKWEEGEVYDIRIKAGTETKRSVRAGKGGTIDLYGSAENYDNLRKIESKDELFAALKTMPGYGPKPKQFVISPSYIRATAKDVGKLDLGREKLFKVAKAYEVDLQDSLIPIYRALQQFSENTNKYFLSEAGSERKKFALEAQAGATTLKTKVDDHIK